MQFSETDEFLLDSVSGFIGAGLGAGAACIVFATKAHREGLEERLKANGLDLAAAFTQGTYLSLDAGETLSMFMVDGLPEPERFAEVVRNLIERAVKGRRRVRIFGEMVAQLWMQLVPECCHPHGSTLERAASYYPSVFALLCPTFRSFGEYFSEFRKTSCQIAEYGFFPTSRSFG